MDNRVIEAARRYHDGTKHPGGVLFNRAYQWDPRDRPLLFKVYPAAETIPLPLDRSPSGMSALEALGSDLAVHEGSEALRVPDRAALSRILFFSAGITKEITNPALGRTMQFRAAACTGALYHIELYLVCGNLPGLDAGVYHYDPQAQALRRLRRGDYRPVLVEASGREPFVASAPAILVATDVVWRNAIKYREREYRHAFWDSGTLLANTLAVAASHRLPAKVVAGFVDDAVVRLLDLDLERELPLALVPLGKGAAGDKALDSVTGITEPLAPLDVEPAPLPEYQSHFPAIRAIHDASSLTDPDQVAAWRSAPAPNIPPAPTPAAHLVPLQPAHDADLPERPLEQVIIRRGSTRQFSREPSTFRQVSTALDRALRPIPADFLPSGATVSDVYLIVNGVEGLQAGAYVLHSDRSALELLKAGDFRQEAYHLALDQDLGGDASVNCYF
ncbi:MAG TPA: SagB family peptide dehydrogenase, partial [Chloroflexota bacterium]|nr:SagB family peptide dehydrogenase [Chloroflexota bacterium]